MQQRELKRLVDGTADPAYVLDGDGAICAWNTAAAELFELAEHEVTGRSCAEVLHGVDECGRECSQDCSILKIAHMRQPLKNYDVRIRTAGREQWCNASVVILDTGKRSSKPYTMHILRPIDIQKRLELIVRDLANAPTNITKTSPTLAADVTKREIEVLRQLADGKTTEQAAQALFISKATANNHVQHAMKKLGAHTRLEAIRRAEKAGLI